MCEEIMSKVKELLKESLQVTVEASVANVVGDINEAWDKSIEASKIFFEANDIIEANTTDAEEKACIRKELNEFMEEYTRELVRKMSEES